MTRQIRIGRTSASFGYALAAALFAGCAPRSLAGALSPAPPPRDAAAVFQWAFPGAPVQPLEAPETPWQAAAEEPASVQATNDGIRIASVPVHRAWASPQLPVADLGASPRGQVEELAWQAAVTVERRFFIVCEVRFAGEAGALLLQVTPFDLQVFQDAERPGGGASQSISRHAGDGEPHAWRLRLDGARTELWLDGSVIWSLDGARTLARVAFGETRNADTLHGGTMLLRDVAYVRRPA